MAYARHTCGLRALIWRFSWSLGLVPVLSKSKAKQNEIHIMATSTRRSTRNGGHDSGVKPLAKEDRRKEITWQQGVEEKLFQLDELGIARH